MEKEALIQRWDAFLAKIEQRFTESLVHAQEACLEQLVATDYDYYTVYRSWQGIKVQISNLIQQISSTWRDKVEPQMRAQGDFYIDESFKGHKLNDDLVYRLQEFQTVLEGTLSQKYYDHAIALGLDDFHCSQCQAKLTVKQDLFRAQYVSCDYCDAVNTFEPETKFVHIGWNIVDNIATLQVLPLHKQKDQAFNAIQEAKSNGQTNLDAPWEAYKTAYFNYYEAYFKARIKLKPSAQDRYQEDMARVTKEYTEFEKIQRYNSYGVH